MQYDYLIVGSGIIGMTIAYKLVSDNKSSKIAIIDKESDVAKHASGRNSGILHAGFYYTKDSLKAKFSVEGNKLMKEFCVKNGIEVYSSKKVVVSKNEKETEGIKELHNRAIVNGVNTSIITEKELFEIDPNIKTHKIALYSPDTSSVNPVKVCNKLKDVLIEKGVDFYFNTPFQKCHLEYDYLVNCAGAYADKIAQKYGLAKNYTMLPFKGLYLKYNSKKKDDIKTNIYPVPNLNNPFLGIHFTKTSDGNIKVGPTAIPALWRENYKGMDNFNLKEMTTILFYELKLFVSNSFNFRKLALEEIKNYNKNILLGKAKSMVNTIDNDFSPMPAGIRAQLLNTDTNELVQDFIIEQSEKSTHILNAVSPAFTCSFAFAEYVVEKIKINKK